MKRGRRLSGFGRKDALARSFTKMPAMFLIGLLVAHVWFLNDPDRIYFIGFAILWMAGALLRAYAHAVLYERSKLAAHRSLALASVALAGAPLLFARGLLANVLVVIALLLMQLIYLRHFDQIADQLLEQKNRSMKSINISITWASLAWVSPLTILLLNRFVGRGG